MQTGPNTSTLIDGWLEEGRASDVVLVTSDDVSWTAAELYDAICSVGERLLEHGAAPGDRVLLVLDDTPAFPATFLGAMRVGAVPVPVNFLARTSDFGYFIDDSEAGVVVCDAAFVDKVAPSVRAGVQMVVANGEAGDAPSLDAWMREGSGHIDPAEVRESDPAFWLYSSGSTGNPKGVVHSHGDIAATCTRYAEPILSIGRGDVTYSSTKLFHAYGLGNNLSFPLWSGATAVYSVGRPTPERILDRVTTQAPTLFFSVPALYNAILADARFDDTDWTSIRLGISAAEPLPPEIWRRFHERTGIEILDGVGSTEMLHIYCSNRFGSVRPGTSGTAVDGYEIEIRDVEGAICPVDAPGEMWVRGPSALSSYWNLPDRSSEKIVDGWFASGDRYRMDADGYCTYEGRVDDMMKVGGLWVSPIEIENRLMEHPAVREAAVVGVDIDLASRIKALVILAEGAETEGLVPELQEWCKAELQRYQYPHVVEFVDDFPRTATGKIQRFKLRESAE